MSATVLVVEDEPLVRLDLATRLADTGYLVFEASSAAEAISILERHPQIRVVFTDIQMPATPERVWRALSVNRGG